MQGLKKSLTEKGQTSVTHTLVLWDREFGKTMIQTLRLHCKQGTVGEEMGDVNTDEAEAVR